MFELNYGTSCVEKVRGASFQELGDYGTSCVDKGDSYCNPINLERCGTRICILTTLSVE